MPPEAWGLRRGVREGVESGRVSGRSGLLMLMKALAEGTCEAEGDGWSGQRSRSNVEALLDEELGGAAISTTTIHRKT